jgi:hypothetical protein
MHDNDWARITAKLTRWQALKLWLGLGRWRVVYPEEHVRSRPMPARIAKTYALLFAGHVEPTTAPVKDIAFR